MNATRPYKQTRRLRHTEARRTRILDALETLLRERTLHEISMDEIAETADVARATVFSQFGSKASLLGALVQRMTERSGQAALIDAFAIPDPVSALDTMLKVGTELWANEAPLYRALVAYATVDPTVADTVTAKTEGRQMACRQLARRLQRDGHLAPGVTRRQAEHMLLVLTSFETHTQLITAGATQAKVAATLRRLASGFVPALAPPAAAGDR